MAEPALESEVPQTEIDSTHLVAFHMNHIRSLVSKLHKLPRMVREATYEMDISWHPAAKNIAQEIVTACRDEDISAIYEPPHKDKKRYQIRINLQRLVRSHQ